MAQVLPARKKLLEEERAKLSAIAPPQPWVTKRLKDIDKELGDRPPVLRDMKAKRYEY